MLIDSKLSNFKNWIEGALLQSFFWLFSVEQLQPRLNKSMYLPDVQAFFFFFDCFLADTVVDVSAALIVLF